MRSNVTLLGRALMTRGMVGCFLSHRRCWQICAGSCSGPMIVFEDDGAPTAAPLCGGTTGLPVRG